MGFQRTQERRPIASPGTFIFVLIRSIQQVNRVYLHKLSTRAFLLLLIRFLLSSVVCIFFSFASKSFCNTISTPVVSKKREKNLFSCCIVLFAVSFCIRFYSSLCSVSCVASRLFVFRSFFLLFFCDWAIMLLLQIATVEPDIPAAPLWLFGLVLFFFSSQLFEYVFSLALSSYGK